MKRTLLAAALALAACAAPAPPVSQGAGLAPGAATAGVDTSRWTQPAPPLRIYGDLYYVGTAGISSFLITTPEGHILIDGGMPDAAPIVEANIAALGFNIRDVRILLNSHAHFDHAGALAALKAASGARLIASAADRPALEAGHVDYGPSAGMQFPPVTVDQTIGDGETVRLGDAVLTAHLTPGHTRGCTSWTMPVRAANGRTRNAFFHCSTTVAGARLVPPAYPGMVSDFQHTFKAISEKSADIFLAPHAEFFDLDNKRARIAAGETDAFIDHRELQIFNTRMQDAFELELARQLVAR